MLATFILKKRQDLVGLSLDLFAGSRDVMDIEIAMNEGSMPPVVLAIAAPSVARQLVKHMDDIEASRTAAERYWLVAVAWYGRRMTQVGHLSGGPQSVELLWRCSVTGRCTEHAG